MHNEIEAPVRENRIGQKKIFKPSSWIASINFINHLVLFNNVLMAILAEPENGKTTFASLMNLGIDPNIDTYLVKANSEQFNQEDLLNQLLLFSALQKGESLSDFTRRVNVNKKPTLFVIDDAHNLDESCLLNLLAELKKFPDVNFFHICLIANNSFLPKLKELEKTYLEDKIHLIKLGNLTESETKTYLLKNLPLTLSKKINPKKLEEFYLITEGNIARVNSQMLDFFKPMQKYIKFKHYGLLASVIFALVGSIYLWPNLSENSPFKQPKIIAVKKEPHVYQRILLKSQIPPFFLAATKEPIHSAPLKRMVSIHNDELDPLNIVVMDKVLTVPKSLHKHLVNTEVFLPSDIMSINELVKKQKEIQQQKNIVHEEDLKAEEEIPADNQQLSKQKHLEKKPLINKQNSENFTIQLMASINKQDLIYFSNAWGIKHLVAVGQIKREGVNWYVLTFGHYKQKQQAVHALGRLPEDLYKFKPWVRSLNSVNAVG